MTRLIFSALTAIGLAFLSFNVAAFCQIYGDCEHDFCKTHKIVNCPGSGMFCGSCSAAHAPCSYITSAIPTPSSCTVCGGPCQYIITGGDGNESSLYDSINVDGASTESLPKLAFDIEFSSDLSELDRLSSEYPHHAAALLRYEYIEKLQGIGRSISTQELTSVKISSKALARRKASGHSLLLDEPYNNREQAFIGPLDRWLEVDIQEIAPSQLEIIIRSYKVNSGDSNIEFEAQTRILAEGRRPDYSVYEIASVRISETQ